MLGISTTTLAVAALALAIAVVAPLPAQNQTQFGDEDTTMRAVRYHSFGQVVDVMAMESAPLPTFGPRDVVIRVVAAALNPVDAKRAGGLLSWLDTLRGALPITTGLDVSGEIVAVGEEVSDLEVGDAVMAMLDAMGGGGLAEYTTAPSSIVVRKPAGVPFATAAAAPLVSLTMLQALGLAAVEPGHRVLVLGGTSATGMVTIQLAKLAGAHVTATCSRASFDLVRDLGADAWLDYRAPGHDAELRAAGPFDRVIDCVGPSGTWDIAQDVLPPTGRLVSITVDGGHNLTIPFIARALGTLAWRGLMHMFGKGPLSLVVAVSPDAVQLRHVAELLDSRKLRVPIDSEYPFEDFQDAFTRLQGGRCKGKVVIHVGHSRQAEE